MLLPGAQLRANQLLCAVVFDKINETEQVVRDAAAGYDHALHLHFPIIWHHTYVQQQVMGLAKMALAMQRGVDRDPGRQTYEEACQGLVNLGKSKEAEKFRYLYVLIESR